MIGPERINGASSREWKEPLKGCIVQNELVFGDIDGNIENVRKIIASVPDDDMDLLVLPELFATGFCYNRFDEYIGRSEEVLSFIKRTASDRSCNMIHTQIVEDEGRVLNRLFLINRQGGVIGHYDKTHLFTRSGENEHFSYGNELRVLDMEGVGIGPLICYESRFPELSRKLVLSGADILVYPTQWPKFRVDQWTTLLRARAIENQCFVIGAGIYGDHGGSIMGGMSSAYSPFGNLLGRIEKGQGYTIFKMDPLEMYKLRKKIPVLNEIRKDLELF